MIHQGAGDEYSSRFRSVSTRRAADAQDGMVEFNVGLPSDRRFEFRTVLLRARLG